MLAQHITEWVNFLELQISPFIEDAEVASNLSKVHGYPCVRVKPFTER